jgi:hypothetical protein
MSTFRLHPSARDAKQAHKWEDSRVGCFLGLGTGGGERVVGADTEHEREYKDGGQPESQRKCFRARLGLFLLGRPTQMQTQTRPRTRAPTPGV